MMNRYSEGARFILEECMGVKDGEKIAVVCDHDKLAPALEIVRTSKAMGFRVLLKEEIHSAGIEIHKEDKSLSEIEECNVVVFLVSDKKTQNLGHSDWRKECSARGTRISFITGPIEEVSRDEIDMVRKRTEFVSKLLTDASVAHIYSSKGTDVAMNLKHRKSLFLTNHIREKGEWGVLPDYMEATIAPQEGETSGVVVVDGTVFGMGLLRESIKLLIEEGEVKEILGGQEARRLKEIIDLAGKNGNSIAELGIGTNHFPYVLSGSLEDRKVLGTIHLALGDNLALGGMIRCDEHIDLQILDATIQLDKLILMKDGSLLVDFKRNESSEC